MCSNCKHLSVQFRSLLETIDLRVRCIANLSNGILTNEGTGTSN